MLSVLDSFSVGAAVYERSGRIVMADDAYLAIVGRPREQMTALERDNLIHPEDHGRTLLALDQQARDGKPFEITNRHMKSDGSAVWVQNRVSRLRADGVERVLVLSRPLPEEALSGAAPCPAGRRSLAGVIGEAAFAMGFQARRFALGRTASLLEAAADSAIDEVRPTPPSPELQFPELQLPEAGRP